jgi:hypothetical protein
MKGCLKVMKIFQYMSSDLLFRICPGKGRGLCGIYPTIALHCPPSSAARGIIPGFNGTGAFSTGIGEGSLLSPWKLKDFPDYHRRPFASGIPLIPADGKPLILFSSCWPRKIPLPALEGLAKILLLKTAPS